MFRLSRKKKKLGQHLSAKGFRSLNRGTRALLARARPPTVHSALCSGALSRSTHTRTLK